MILKIVDWHARRFPDFGVPERLERLDMTPSDYWRLKNNVGERRRRESAIPREDVAEMVGFIVDNPDVGAARAAATLLDKESALVSPGFINEARQEIIRSAEQCYRQRDCREKEAEKALRDRQEDNRRQYSHIQAVRPHHIWAVDFIMLDFLGYRLAACEVYDVYSQHYLAIRIGTGCGSDPAAATLHAAIAETGNRPPGTVLRRDNGSAFITDYFRNILVEHSIEDRPVPPGQPWYNGSLESGNGTLRTAIMTAAMRDALRRPRHFEHARKDVRKAVDLLQNICDGARKRLNEDISRTKFNMPPAQVLQAADETVRQRHNLFKERKMAERKRRMSELQANPRENGARKSFMDKVRQCFSSIAARMRTDELYVLNETLHGRFKLVQV